MKIQAISFKGREQTFPSHKNKPIVTDLERDKKFFNELMNIKVNDVEKINLHGEKKRTLIDRILNRPKKFNLDMRLKDNQTGDISTSHNMIYLGRWKLSDNTMGDWFWRRDMETKKSRTQGQKLLNQAREHLIEIARKFNARKV